MIIWLKDVDCDGNEANLDQCESAGNLAYEISNPMESSIPSTDI